ncbi:MAG: family 16 glycosylhydrolase [Lachnospiraceae bacterium]|nr:family 16 glycosylhydrolase [Lachnospiraceae bacterium]
MKKHHCLLLAALLATTALTSCKNKETQTYKKPADTISFNGKEYKLTFEDDFDFFDTDKWAYCPEMERQDVGGVWRDSCSRVEDGNYIITCSLADDNTPMSGGIRSNGKYEQTYGLYHIRCKMEKADGLWYAFWLMTDRMEEGSVGNGATDGAELDIFELVPGAEELCMSVHWDGYGDELKSRFDLIDVDDDFYNTYHDIWYLWDKDGYHFYLDGTDSENLVFDFPGDEYGDGTCAVGCDMIISAEYGIWGGDIDPAQLPARYYVDLVQVYSEY